MSLRIASVFFLPLISSLVLAAVTADEYYEDANRLWAEGKVADAYLSFEKAINLNPSATWSSDALERLVLLATAAPDEQLKILGKAAESLAKKDDATTVSILREADHSGLITERLKPWLAMWLARALAAGKSYDEAQGVLIAELARHPLDPAAPRLMLERIKLYILKGVREAAEEVYSQMEKAYPQSAELELAKGLLGK